MKEEYLELRNLFGNLKNKKMNDLIADMLARIQNAIMRKKETVDVLNTKINNEILKVLKNEKMIEEEKAAEELQEEDDVGRNELCPCGSGLKYKKCCGK